MADISVTGTKRLRFLARCDLISTRVLLEISLDPAKHELEYCGVESDFKESYEKRGHDVYIIDITCDNKERNISLFKDATSIKLNGLRRIILLTETVPDADSNRMAPFGPLCFLEVNFTRARFREALNDALTIKDTGVRVKADASFFDITIFKA